MPERHAYQLFIKTIFLAMLGGLGLGSSCRGGEEATDPDGKERRSFLTYEHGGGMDMYRDGDRYGSRIEIDSAGGFVLYERIYREGKDEHFLENQRIGQGTLEKETLDTLRKKVRALDISKLPDRLPDVDPRRVELMEPAETVSLALSPKATEEQSVRAHMGAAPEHYPEAFLRLHRFLRQLIRAKREQILD